MPSPTAAPTWLTPRRALLAALVLAVGGAAWLLLALWVAVGANHGPGFPLDDPWIHLQFARNLHEFGAFSYFRDEMVTAGSTSPLYTLLLAAAFFVTRDEMAVSWALGIGSCAAATLLFCALLRRLVPARPALPLLGLALFALEPRTLWAALSGMETSLFIAGVLASLWLFLERRGRALGVCLGICLWLRPEALVLAALMGALGLCDAFRGAPATARVPALAAMARRCALPLAIVLAFVALYAAFNVHLAGTPLPNTYAAKTRYSDVETGFLRAVLRFVASGHFLPVDLLALVGAMRAARRAWRGGRFDELVLVLWPLLLVAAYQIKLPYMYQQGRYLMPMLPAILALAILGLDAALGVVGKRWTLVVGALAALLLPVFALASARMSRDFAKECRYISERQVAAARWMSDHLPADAVVATHDIGAIAFYSGRRVVDLVGLVSPELIQASDPQALTAQLERKKVTHLAVLGSWYAVDGGAAPLFRTDPKRPEVMEVFAFEPGRTRLAEPEEVGWFGAGPLHGLTQ